MAVSVRLGTNIWSLRHKNPLMVEQRRLLMSLWTTRFLTPLQSSHNSKISKKKSIPFRSRSQSEERPREVMIHSSIHAYATHSPFPTWVFNLSPPSVGLSTSQPAIYQPNLLTHAKKQPFQQLLTELRYETANQNHCRWQEMKRREEKSIRFEIKARNRKMQYFWF